MGEVVQNVIMGNVEVLSCLAVVQYCKECLSIDVYFFKIYELVQLAEKIKIFPIPG